MKKHFIILMAATLGCTASLLAQERRNLNATSPAAANSAGDYSTDIGVVIDAERQALEQAQELLNGGGKNADQAALKAAIKEMENSQSALEAAKKSPDKLAAALAAGEAAYQALLKATPREYRMSRSRSRSQGGSSSGQPGQQQLDQLELTGEDKRYENENQATASPTQQQRDQSESLDRLKQLARRQQDLNDRLRDLQTALQEAHTDQEREDIQRQHKRLRDEERQMLSDVDELRQQLEQSPTRQNNPRPGNNWNKPIPMCKRRRRNSTVSQSRKRWRPGARAEQKLQTLRENMRQQTSSQFAEQMRQLRSQSRDLADQEGKISHDLDALNNSGQKSLDDSAQRQKLAEQMNRSTERVDQSARRNARGDRAGGINRAAPVQTALRNRAAGGPAAHGESVRNRRATGGPRFSAASQPGGTCRASEH